MLFKISNETELLDCFRPGDQKEVLVPQDLKFPVRVQDYLSWIEPSGCRVYLIFRESVDSAPLGIVFRRDQDPGVSAVMCEWCHSVRSGESVGLLTARASNKKRVGMNLCRDLSCKGKVTTAPAANDVVELIAPAEKMRRIIQRMSSFARRELF